MSAVVGHDVECGGYEADLGLWEELADVAGGAILDLGCGTGRVALHLARRGHRVVGLDSDDALLAALEQRAAGVPMEVELGDARRFDLGIQFGLVLAPMQLLQLFEASERVECLRCVAAHLRPGGRTAVAIVERMPAPEAGAAPLPDVREVDGWVYSSLPIDTRVEDGAILVRRLRQVVSPQGESSDEINEIRLLHLSAEALEREALEAGLTPADRCDIPATEAHVGSTVLLLEKEP
jgi:SAM-dependent methyltransferase